MKYKGFIARVEFDIETGVLYGRVTNSDAIATFQGDTIADLEKAFANAVEDYLARCVEEEDHGV